MAEKQVATFSSTLASKLKRMADSWTPGASTAGHMTAGNAVGCWIMQAMAEIPAATGQCATPGTLIGITPGVGTARICHRDRATGLVVPYRPNGLDVTNTVYNLKKRKIKGGGYFLGTRDLNGSIYVEEYYSHCSCAQEDGTTTLTVVTNVSFDVSNCRLVVCTRQICLPPGAEISEESCGGGGGGGSGGLPETGGEDPPGPGPGGGLF
jgi:hypothetical protein